MIPLWMLYAVAVSTLLGVAAVGGERLLRHRGRPARGVWLGALGASVAVPTGLWLFAGAGGSVGSAVRGWLAGLGSGSGAHAGGSGGGPEVGPVGLMGSWARAADPGLAPLLAPLDVPLLAAWAALSAVMAAVVGGTAVALHRRARSWGEARLQGERVLVSPDTGPAVLGLRRPRVVLPTRVLALGRRTLGIVLLHEREHVRGRDTWLVHGALVAVVLMPWNPALWWQLRRLRLAVEVDCDRRVLSRGIPPKRYGDVLLEVEGRLGGTALNALALGNPAASLKRRLEMMASESEWRRGWKVGAAAFAGAVALAVACEAPLPSVDEEAESEAAAGEEEEGERIDLRSPGEEPAGEPSEPVDVPPPPDDVEVMREEPSFTPHTDAPELRNREEVAGALREAYPDDLRDAGIEGDVIMHFFINEEGRVENFIIDRPAEEAQLNEAALEVADVFEFSPAYNRDEPVPVWISLPIRFEPEG